MLRYDILIAVDEKERKNGHDPEKELLNDGFQDYQRPWVINQSASPTINQSIGQSVSVVAP